MLQSVCYQVKSLLHQHHLDGLAVLRRHQPGDVDAGGEFSATAIPDIPLSLMIARFHVAIHQPRNFPTQNVTHGQRDLTGLAHVLRIYRAMIECDGFGFHTRLAPINVFRTFLRV